MLHSKVAPAASDLNLNFAFALSVFLSGDLVMVVSIAPPPPPVHAFSVGVTELLRGDGVPRAKSAELTFVSSELSRRVAQPGAIDRTSALPSGIAAAGAPAAAGREPL